MRCGWEKFLKKDVEIDPSFGDKEQGCWMLGDTSPACIFDMQTTRHSSAKRDVRATRAVDFAIRLDGFRIGSKVGFVC